MSKYIHFTAEQKQRANSVDLADFLRAQGEEVTRAGRDWRWERHDSVTIRGSRWYQHSAQEGGLAIDFVRKFYDCSFPEAVTMLLSGKHGAGFTEWRQASWRSLKNRKRKHVLLNCSKACFY